MIAGTRTEYQSDAGSTKDTFGNIFFLENRPLYNVIAMYDDGMVKYFPHRIIDVEFFTMS